MNTAPEWSVRNIHTASETIVPFSPGAWQSSQALCIRKKVTNQVPLFIHRLAVLALHFAVFSRQKRLSTCPTRRALNKPAGHLMQPCRSVRRQLDACMSISGQGLKKLACSMQTSRKCILLAKAPMMRSTNICVHHGAKRGDKVPLRPRPRANERAAANSPFCQSFDPHRLFAFKPRIQRHAPRNPTRRH